MIREIVHCRICNSANLPLILDLGAQALTGIFPRSRAEKIPVGPLALVKCLDCGLVQLKHSYDPGQLYGSNYGYRSGLNNSMLQHLSNKAGFLQKFVRLRKDDVVVDIGSNDGSMLAFYPEKEVALVGFDPAAEKFKKFYRADIDLVVDFFSSSAFQKKFPGKKAKIITSISMFYDLESPLEFVKQVHSILADDGIWHLEQSYLPSMLNTNAYDTICHEHLEYYALKQIKWMTDRVGLKIIALEKNDINGGSFAITVAKSESHYSECLADINAMLADELSMGLDDSGLEIFKSFELVIKNQRDTLVNLLHQLKQQKKKVCGYGASTKGNVILQHCGIDDTLLSCIAEVNSDKFGSYTPGTQIPILSEQEVHAMQPDYLLVLPWHFKNSILEREKKFLANGGKFIFSLPQLEIVAA